MNKQQIKHLKIRKTHLEKISLLEDEKVENLRNSNIDMIKNMIKIKVIIPPPLIQIF